MNANKVFTYVGFSIKAKKIIFGVDNIVTSKKIAKVVLYSDSLSENSLKKLLEYAKLKNIDAYRLDLSAVLPNKNCKALGLTDSNLAEAVKSELKEENNA